ncbi:MAG TPA: DNA recombination protein RmuC [Alphaproteobacteria bacterium]|nr:DNA recombination protein RmuC [Alphaproteobacteria bacterium]
MPISPDVLPYVLSGGAAGLILGLAAGFVLFRKSDTTLQIHLSAKAQTLETQLQDLLQKNARLESAMESLQEQKQLIENAKLQMTADFKAMSLEALNASRENFLALAQEKFSQLHTSAQTSIKDVVTPVEKSLKTMDEKIALLERDRHNAYGELREHLKTMKLDQEKLRGETATLVQALRSPSTRGQWGEMQLKRTLEMAGLVEGVHFDQQVSIDSQRPDVVVRLPGGKNIIIDSKAPIDAYLDALKEGATEQDRRTAMNRHARHVRDHIKALGSKAYWEKFDTPEFVVMFLPGESYYSAALECDPGLLEAGVDQKVIPATPTTLISLLKAVAYGWQQEKLHENAQKIATLGRDLYKRLSTFGNHMQKVGKGLSGAINSYNDAVGSLERSVLPSARRFQELQGIGNEDDLPELDGLDKSARQLSAAELIAAPQQEDVPDDAPDFTDENTDTPAQKAKNG